MSKKGLNDINKSVEKFVEDRLVKILKKLNLGDEVNVKVLQANNDLRTIKIKGPRDGLKTTKKAPSGYLIYCADKRQDVKDINPEFKSTDIIRELGRLWKLESQSTKDKYNQTAKEIDPTIKSNANTTPKNKKTTKKSK